VVFVFYDESKGVTMPLIKTECAGNFPDEQKKKLTLILSEICARVTGKPESYVMSIVRDGLCSAMAGKETPCAFVEIKGIGGLSKEINKKLSAELSAAIEKELKIPSSSIYLNFTDVSPSNWGWNGGTFA
jgi:phenylpyruvate tautomerase